MSNMLRNVFILKQRKLGLLISAFPKILMYRSIQSKFRLYGQSLTYLSIIKPLSCSCPSHPPIMAIGGGRNLEVLHPTRTFGLCCFHRLTQVAGPYRFCLSKWNLDALQT